MMALRIGPGLWDSKTHAFVLYFVFTEISTVPTVLTQASMSEQYLINQRFLNFGICFVLGAGPVHYWMFSSIPGPSTH